MLNANPFGYSNYILRKQFLKVFGGSFRIYNPEGSLALFASMKAFKLKEDISIYPDESKTSELLRIKARNVIDFSASYDVFDSTTDEKIGALRRRGFKSMLKDEWIILDSVDNELGCIREDSMLLALVRRFLTNLVPQSFKGEVRGTPVFTFKQHFNPFIEKINLDFSCDAGCLLDRRLGLAAAVLLCAIEGRQS